MTEKGLWRRAQAIVPGGVNSPSRSYGPVGADTVFMARGEGALLYDVEGKVYIDYLGAYGPGILGHAHPELTEAVRRQAQHGVLFGTPHPAELRLAERVKAAIPMLEMVRLTSTGTEAVMSAVRLARGYTGRSVLVKCAGNYHGHFDAVLSQAGSGAASMGGHDAAGVPEGVRRDTRTVPFNDVGALEAAVRETGDELAAILLEPLSGNMGVVWPAEGYLEAARALADQSGALLIYDEVILAFRGRFGAAFEELGPAPDLLCMGKILGGGLPLGAYGGRAEVMCRVAPAGPVYQAGTHAGNPLSVAGGLAALDILGRPGVYERLEERSGRLADGLLDIVRRLSLPLSLTRFGSMFTLFFRPQAPVNAAETADQDAAAFAHFFRAMLERGILLAPSFHEAWFLSVAHEDGHVTRTLEAAEDVLAGMKGTFAGAN